MEGIVDKVPVNRGIVYEAKSILKESTGILGQPDIGRSRINEGQNPLRKKYLVCRLRVAVSN